MTIEKLTNQVSSIVVFGLQNDSVVSQNKISQLNYADNQAITHLNNQIRTNDPPPEKEKSVGDFLDKVLQEQPLPEKFDSTRFNLPMKFSKSADDMTVFDYKMDFLRAEYKAAGYGMLTDSEIMMAESALEAKDFERRWDNFDLESLRNAQKNNKPFHNEKGMLERAVRGGQAVLQYQQDKATKEAELKAKAESETNQMLVDPLRLGVNMFFRWGERMLNTPRDLAESEKNSSIVPLPGFSIAEDLSRKAYKSVTGNELPKTPTKGELFKTVTGQEFPEIPEIKLPRPFEYQSEKYKREGKTGEEVGATILDLLLLKRGIIGKSKPTPESLKTLGGIPEVKVANVAKTQKTSPLVTQSEPKANKKV